MTEILLDVKNLKKYFKTPAGMPFCGAVPVCIRSMQAGGYPAERSVAGTFRRVLCGGLSGCFAAIAAARKGLSVTLVEKGATERSGSAGTGFDHWESACTNPCSGVTPEEIAEAYVNEQDWYSIGAILSGTGTEIFLKRRRD